jgi:hypothetical protein
MRITKGTPDAGLTKIIVESDAISLVPLLIFANLLEGLGISYCRRFTTAWVDV